MTKQEFITNRQAMTHNCNRWLPVCFVVIPGILLGNIPLARFIERTHPESWIQVVDTIVVIGLVIATLLLMVWMLNRQEKQFGLKCPNCRKSLSGITAQIAVASGACGYCGEPVFTDAKGKPDHVAGSATHL